MRDGKFVILYVDDDQDCLDTMRLILEPNGFVMEEACSAEEGLRVFQETNPDALLVDLMMEEVDAGASFIKEVKLLGNTSPVYMLSSVGDALYNNTAYTELGLSGIFQKPILAATILSTLNRKLAPSQRKK